jgi:hypothetical protein
MEIAPFWLILLIPLCISLGYLGGGISALRIHRRCTKLEYLVGDIEDRLNKVRAKDAAKAKWDLKKWEDEALAHEHREPATAKRFDNDPL